MSMREKITFANNEKVEVSDNGAKWQDAYYVGAVNYINNKNFLDARPHCVTDGYGSVYLVKFMRKIPVRHRRWINSYLANDGSVFTSIHRSEEEAARLTTSTDKTRYLETHRVEYEEK